MAVILLRQTIRNIASIVSADIDYEKGLVDYGTNNPSPLFLISGDTGAGKTAIIDALTLALYKTTPRINNVVNRNKNNFSNSNGNSVSITDISQYTRIGISSKEECYTEVEFVDRRGRHCVARLELGYTSTGKYKTPTWTYQVGSDIFSRDADINAAIKDAIGLTFAQYQHTSLLAQGKFDAFLTGGKEERKLIMEQLTNTEKFTEFGEAITERFKIYKKEKDAADQKVNNYFVLLLTAQELSDLQDEYSLLISEITILNKSIEDDETKKATTERLINAEREKTNAEVNMHQLDAVSKSAQHLANVKMVADWDNSNDARQALNEYDRAVREIASSQQALRQGEASFGVLDDDLQCRKELLANLEAESKRLETWLTANAAKAPVYAEAGAITTKMNGYTRLCLDMAQNNATLANERAKTQQLKQNVNAAATVQGNALHAVNDIKAEIEKLKADKDALRPADIATELNAANARYNALDGLKKNIEKRDGLNRTIAEKSRDIAALEDEKKRLVSQYDIAVGEYDTIKKEADSTTVLYNDVMLSKEETLQKMKEQLASDKADTCPLCGSRVNDWSVNLDAVIEPIEKKKREKDEALEAAEKKKTDAISEKSKAEGKISSLNASVKELQAELGKMDESINEDVIKTGLDAAKELLPQVDAAIIDINNLIVLLNQKNQQVLMLDNQITAKNTDLQTAQEKLRVADKNKTVADNALTANDKEIKRLVGEIEREETELNDLILDINSLLAGYYGNWMTDIAVATASLRKDANEYNSQQKSFDNLKTQIVSKSNDIDTISATKNNIIRLCPSWSRMPSAKPYPSANVITDWNNLYGNVYAHINNITANNATKTAKSKLLDAYYAKTGNNEPSLRALIANAAVIASLRQSIIKLNNDIAMQQQLIQTAVQAIAECCNALSISSPADAEPLADIVLRLEKNKSDRDAKNVRLGVVDNTIKSDANNHTLYDNAIIDQKQKGLLFEKWKRLNDAFGGNKLCLLVQSFIMRPLLNNANLYLSKITDRYRLTFNSQNEQLSIFVLDKYNQDQIRSATVLSGGERFMISLALSLALSALNRSESNFNVLFIDEGFGTLDEKSLDAVMKTLEMLPSITGHTDRRVGIISHIEELVDRIPTQIQVIKQGNGRSAVNIVVK